MEAAPKKNASAIITVALLLSLAIVGLVCQQVRVNNLNKQISNLKTTQLPQRSFASYEDCTRHGGKSLTTVDGDFSACLGGKSEGSDVSYDAFLQYSAQNLPRIDARSTAKVTRESRIDGANLASADLLTFLKKENDGCGTDNAVSKQRAFFKVIKQVPNRFALMNYGCTDDQDEPLGSAFMIAMKLADGWSFLSPTNNFNEQGVPSCLMTDMFKISKQLTPQCFENTGYNDGHLKAVTNP